MCDTKETFALSRDPPLRERAVVRYRLSRYSQPANLKSEQGNFLPGSPFSYLVPLVSSSFVSDRVGCLVSCVRLYISLVELPPPRHPPLVLYVFLKVDKPDAIASLLAENFLRKYARVRHSLEPLDTRRSRLSPLSFPFGQGLLIERNMLKLMQQRKRKS